MTTREWPFSHSRPSGRELIGLVLGATGHWLVQAAQLLSGPKREGAQAEPVLEFHAEAGAPEGALYVDGQLVGRLVGVNRL